MDSGRSGRSRPIPHGTDGIAGVDIEPDASSSFVVAETRLAVRRAGYEQPGAFAVPNRGGETVQVCGRAANANDLECAAELSTVTRWQIGGSGGSDAQAPPAPTFGIGAGPGGGVIGLTGVSFPDLANTHTISSGTLTLYYRDELAGPSPISLASSATADDLTLNVSGTAAAAPARTFNLAPRSAGLRRS